MLPAPADISAVWFVLYWLAAWRVTALLCYDEGPFEVLTRLRRALARIGLQRVFMCFHCTAFWVSLLLVGAVFEPTWRSLILVFAIAGAASITERWLGGGIATSTEEDEHG